MMEISVKIRHFLRKLNRLSSGKLALTGIHREQKITFNNVYNTWKMHEKYFYLLGIFSLLMNKDNLLASFIWKHF